MKNLMIAMVVLVVASSACMTSASGTLDPVGNWDTVMSWTQGTCQLTGTLTTGISVVRAPDGTLGLTDTKAQTVTGAVLCSEHQCQISFTETGAVQGGTTLDHATVHANLTLDEAGDIIGAGDATFAFHDGTSCYQDFVASGHMGEGVVISP